MSEYYLRQLINRVPVVTDEALVRYGYRDAIGVTEYRHASELWRAHVSIRGLLIQQLRLS